MLPTNPQQLAILQAAMNVNQQRQNINLTPQQMAQIQQAQQHLAALSALQNVGVRPNAPANINLQNLQNLQILQSLTAGFARPQNMMGASHQQSMGQTGPSQSPPGNALATSNPGTPNLNASMLFANPQNPQQKIQLTQDHLRQVVDKYQTDLKKYDELIAACANPVDRQRLIAAKQKVSQDFVNWRTTAMASMQNNTQMKNQMGNQGGQQINQMPTNVHTNVGQLNASQIAALAQLTSNNNAMRQASNRMQSHHPILSMHLNNQALQQNPLLMHLQQQQQQQQQQNMVNMNQPDNSAPSKAVSNVANGAAGTSPVSLCSVEMLTHI